MVNRIPLPFLTPLPPKRFSMALRRVSGPLPFAERLTPPSLALASPAISSEGLMLAVSNLRAWGSSASTRRSHNPSDAVSAMASQPLAVATRRSSVSMTVLPYPRCPVMSMSRPGAPAPFSSASMKSSIMGWRPMRIGGIFPAVGLNGFADMAPLPCNKTERPKLPPKVYQMNRTYTNVYRMNRMSTAPEAPTGASRSGGTSVCYG